MYSIAKKFYYEVFFRKYISQNDNFLSVGFRHCNCKKVKDIIIVSWSKLNPMSKNSDKNLATSEIHEMSTENIIDDFFVIDSLPSPVLIELDEPGKYKKKRITAKPMVPKEPSSATLFSSPPTEIKYTPKLSRIERSITSKYVSKFKKKSVEEVLIDDEEDDIIIIPQDACSSSDKKLDTSLRSSPILIENKVEEDRDSIICVSNFSNMKPSTADHKEKTNHQEQSTKSAEISSNLTHKKIYSDAETLCVDPTNSDTMDDTDEVECQGSFVSDYLSLKVAGKGFFKNHLLSYSENKQPYKQHYSSGGKIHHSSGAKKTSPYRKNDRQKWKKSEENINELYFEKGLSKSDNHLGLDERKTSDVPSSDEEIILELDTKVQKENFKSGTSDSTPPHQNENKSSISRPLFEPPFNEDEIHDSDDSSKSIASLQGYECVEDDYDTAPMDLEEESDTEINIVVDNKDFVPLSELKLSDIEYDVYISDEVLNKRRDLESLRRWELTGLGEKLLGYNSSQKVGGCIFTILSYNVLAQQLIYDNRSLYDGCDPAYLDWGYRWPLLQHEIRHLMPDILTLQEVQSSHYNTHYLPWFTYLGYTCIFKKRTGEKVDGCAIIFDSKKFNLIEESSVEYLQPHGGRILNRDNIGLIAKLTPKNFDMPFCVATTHILFNPKRSDVKLAQIVLLLTELDRFCYKGEEGGRPSYCPLILTGDFNTEPRTKLMDFIRRNHLRFMGLSKRNLSNLPYEWPKFDYELIPPVLGVSDYCQHEVLGQGRSLDKMRGNLFSLKDKRSIEEKLIKFNHSSRPSNISQESIANQKWSSSQSTGSIHHAFNFKSVYYHKLFRCNEAEEVTTFQKDWVTVDYIYYTKILNETKLVEGPLKLIGRYGLLNPKEAQQFGPMPSATCPSDHFPLAAQFLLKPK